MLRVPLIIGETDTQTAFYLTKTSALPSSDCLSGFHLVEAPGFIPFATINNPDNSYCCLSTAFAQLLPYAPLTRDQLNQLPSIQYVQIALGNDSIALIEIAAHIHGF